MALAGGGTRGAYHLGVWKALEELEIEIGAITGTSIGSVNGALFAQGDFEKAVELWENIEVSDVLDLSDNLLSGKNLLDYKNLIPLVQEFIRKNGLQTMPFRHTIETVIDEEKIRKSDICYGLNTTSVYDIEEVELFVDKIPKGQLIDLIMASSCFPGFKTQYIDDKAYADGGIMNNLPVDMLFGRGYKNVIAVDVGGLGIIKSPRFFDTNIVSINCQKPLLGIFEFEKQAIKKSIKQSYYDTYKAFGRLVGNIYYFNTLDYYKSRAKYSEQIMTGLEIAAQAFEIEELAVYKVDALIKGVIESFELLKSKQSEQDNTLDSVFKLKPTPMIVRLTDMILNKHTDGFGNKLAQTILGNRLLAANAVAYFVNLK